MTGRGDDYTTDCVLHYAYFQSQHKIIAIDIKSIQQALDAYPKGTQQINFNGNLQSRSYILELYNILEQTRFTTSNRKLDNLYS